MVATLRTSTLAAAVALGIGLAAGAAAAQDRSDWPDSVTVGTASIGGTYFVYGGGWANIISEVVGVPASVENTGGPVANAALVHTGELPFGQVTLGPAFDAWTGNSPVAPGVEHTNMRAMFPMYETPFQAVTLAGSGIDSVAGFDGATIGIGPAAGTAGQLVPRFMEALGIDATFRNAGYGDIASQIGDGLLDGGFFAAGIPTPNISELDAQNDLNVFSFTDEQRQQILDEFSFMAPFTMPAGTYESVEADIQTVAVWNFTIASKDLPEDFVYEVVKAVFENQDRMIETHRTARNTVPENAQFNSWMPFHPGAVRYYEEIGIEIPEDLKG